MITVSGMCSAQKTGNLSKGQRQIEKCMLNIKKWMDRMCLKMNPSKTEFIYFGYPRQIQKCTESSINVAGDLIVRSECIKYLGAWLDSALNFKFHITKKCQCAMINFIRIRSIHHLLDQDTTTSLCLSLCISHVDYCNSILYGLPDVTLGKTAMSPEHVCMLSAKKVKV